MSNFHFAQGTWSASAYPKARRRLPFGRYRPRPDYLPTCLTGRRGDHEIVGHHLALVLLPALVGRQERGVGRGVLPAVFRGVELDLEMEVQRRRCAPEIVGDIAQHVALLDVLVG